MQQVAVSAPGAEAIWSCCKMMGKALLLKSVFLTSSVGWEDVLLVFCLGLYSQFRAQNGLCCGDVGQGEE